MTAESRRRFAEVLRGPGPDLGLACLLVAVEAHPDLDVEAGLRALDALAGAARPELPAGAPAYDAARGLRRALGDVAGFRGYAGDYGDLRASLLPDVLRRRRGLPILLSVVYLEVARRLGVPLDGLGRPGHFVVGVPLPAGGHVVLDPFHGGRLAAPAAPAAPDDRPWSVPEILARLLANVRTLSGRSDAVRTRLWAVDLSLLVPGADAGLRRERGELLARLGDFVGAARELESYAGAVAAGDPEAADLALRGARMCRARLS